jgi:hypothetical protein
MYEGGGSMKISCNVIADLLELYSDNVISSDTKTLVETHLSDCAACRERLAGIKQSVVIPAETTAEPLKFLSKKIRKRFYVVWVAAFLLFLILFIRIEVFPKNDGLLPPIAFERVGIEKVEENELAVMIIFSEPRGGTSRINYNDEALTAEIHFCAHRYRKSELNIDDVIFSYGKTVYSARGGPYELIAVYYCTDKTCIEWGGNRCKAAEKHLIWGK